MSSPKVDILMATYNGARFVREQIESIQGQTFTDWRLLVSDDCSTDETLQIVRKMAASDSRIEIVGEGVSRGGAKENFAFLLTFSEAPYVALSDQDDIWLPNKLMALLEEMQRLERCSDGAGMPLLAFSDAKVVDEQLNVLSPSFADFSRLNPSRTSFAHLLAQNVAPGFLMLVNRALVDLASLSAGYKDVAMHDWWLMLCAAAFGRIGYISKCLALYRQHADNAIGAQSFSAVERALRMKRMDERFEETLRQAVAFRDVFSGSLRADQLRVVVEYAAMASGGSLENVVHLSKCGCWKAGTRKVGQILSAIRRGGVLAAIVTYNPDIVRLRENFEAIAPQVDGVLVFDNGSKNAHEIEKLAMDFNTVVCLAKDNFGLAVALNELCFAAWSMNVDHVVLLDQDSVSSPGMVEELMSEVSGMRAIVAPVIIDRNRKDIFEAEDRTALVKRPITSGTLLNLHAWQEVGGYDERLFVDWVDDEFYCNLFMHGWDTVRCYKTCLLHELGNQEHVFAGPGLSVGDKRTVKHEYCRQNYPLWRWHDRARSEAITCRKYDGTRIGREERLIFLKSTIGRILILETNKLEKLRAVVQGWREGRKTWEKQ